MLSSVALFVCSGILAFQLAATASIEDEVAVRPTCKQSSSQCRPIGPGGFSPPCIGSRPESLEDHLIGPALRKLPLPFSAHGPGQQRKSQQAQQQGNRGGQIVYRIGEKVRAGANGAAQIRECAACTAVLGTTTPALGNDPPRHTRCQT